MQRADEETIKNEASYTGISFTYKLNQKKETIKSGGLFDKITQTNQTLRKTEKSKRNENLKTFREWLYRL